MQPIAAQPVVCELTAWAHHAASFSSHPIPLPTTPLQAQRLRGGRQPMTCATEAQHGRALAEDDAQPSPSSPHPAKHARTGL